MSTARSQVLPDLGYAAIQTIPGADGSRRSAGRRPAPGSPEDKGAVFGAAGFALPRPRAPEAGADATLRTCSSIRAASAPGRTERLGRITRTKGTPRASAIPVR